MTTNYDKLSPVEQYFADSNTLEALKEAPYNLTVKEYSDRILLDYDQTRSKKDDPIVMDCRGTIIDKSGKVICRSFTRFFNLGECEHLQKDIDISKCFAVEKVDGSFIRIYWYAGKWEIATRGTAFGESQVLDYQLTFRELVFKALRISNEQEFQDFCEVRFDKTITYMFEVTSVENRVVKHYEGYKLWWLGWRKNTDYTLAGNEFPQLVPMTDFYFPKNVFFDSFEDVKNSANSLQDLDEGWVLWQDDAYGMKYASAPVAKVKSPAYVVAHHIRGEGMSQKRCWQLIISGEVEEYLTYFPKDSEFVRKRVNVIDLMYRQIENNWAEVFHIKDKKYFAECVSNMPFKDFLFSMYKIYWEYFNKKTTIGLSSCFLGVDDVYEEVLHNMTEHAKIRLFEKAWELYGDEQD